MRLRAPPPTSTPPWAPALAACALCSLLQAPPLRAVEPPAPVPVVSSGSPVAEEVWGLVDKYFLDRSFNGNDWSSIHDDIKKLGPLSEKDALEKSSQVVQQLGDRYSRVLTPTQAVKLSKYDVTGVGINLVIADSGEVKIGAVPPYGSDAAKMGVTFGDVVLSINGRSCVGMTSFDALEAIQGDGENVVMEIKPGEGGATREVTLRKTFFPRNPVSSRLVSADDGTRIGYIKLTEFNAQCKRKVSDAMAELEKAGASRLILDLRGNGGGVLDGALGIAGFFLDKPLVLFVTDANNSMQPLYSRETVRWKQPLQVWVDAGTASSGEVLAGALHDNCRSAIVGKTTYGKGVIQGVFGLSDGGALVETVASYSTPSGKAINKLGIAPDNDRTFVSDVLGESFVDADVKAASFALPACTPPPADVRQPAPAARNSL